MGRQMGYSITAGRDWPHGDEVDQDAIKWGLGAIAALLAWVIAQKDKATDKALTEERAKAAQALAHEREQNASMSAMRAEIKDSFLLVEKRLSVVGEALLDLREEFSGKLSAVQQQQQAMQLQLEEQRRRLDAVSELTDRKRGQLNALVLALQAQRIITTVPGDQSMAIMAVNTDQGKKETGP